MYTKLILLLSILYITNINSTVVRNLELDLYEDYNLDSKILGEDAVNISKTSEEYDGKSRPDTVYEEIHTNHNENNFNNMKNEEFGSEEERKVAIETDLKENYDTTSDSEVSKIEVLLQLQRLLGFEWSEEHPENRRTKVPPNISPPQFMTDLYQSISESNDENRANPHGANIVRSLPEKEPASHGLFKFDLNGISAEEDIIEAELHIYRIGLEQHGSAYHPPYYLLRVYQVMPMSRYSFSPNPDVHQLLNVHYVPAFSTGWQIFKVNRAVESWRNGTSPNLGLLVTATTILGEPVEVRFARRGLQGDIYLPNLILFTKKTKQNTNTNSISHVAHKILRRSLQDTLNSQFNKMLTNLQSNEIRSNDIDVHETIRCHKKSFYIDFKELGWSEWIIAPQGINANLCTGKCSFPIRKDENPTNYAVLQSMIKELHGSNMTSPSCVPTKLQELTILYFDDYLNVLFTALPNMIVETCGCR